MTNIPIAGSRISSLIGFVDRVNSVYIGSGQNKRKLILERMDRVFRTIVVKSGELMSRKDLFVINKKIEKLEGLLKSSEATPLVDSAIKAIEIFKDRINKPETSIEWWIPLFEKYYAPDNAINKIFYYLERHGYQQIGPLIDQLKIGDNRSFENGIRLMFHQINIGKIKLRNLGINTLEELYKLVARGVKLNSPITRLDLEHFGRLDSRGVMKLVRAVRNLQALSVDAKLTLQEIDFILFKHRRMKILSLHGVSLDDSLLQKMTNRVNLEELKLVECRRGRRRGLPKTWLPQLAVLKNLRVLHFENCPSLRTAKDIQALRRFSRLEDLSLSGCVNLNSPGVRALSNLTGLKSLCLSRVSGIDASVLSELSLIKGLLELDLSRTQIAGHSFACFEKFSKLESLFLREMNVKLRETELKHISKMKLLKSLSLSYSRVGGSLGALNTLSSTLNKLELEGVKGVIRQLKVIKLPKLVLLNLSSCEIDDAAIPLLIKFQKLEELDVSHTQITSTGIKILRDKLPMLRLLLSEGCEDNSDSEEVASLSDTDDEGKSMLEKLTEL